MTLSLPDLLADVHRELAALNGREAAERREAMKTTREPSVFAGAGATDEAIREARAPTLDHSIGPAGTTTAHRFVAERTCEDEYPKIEVALQEDALDPARLKKMELFSTLSEEELDQVAELAEEMSVEEGTELIVDNTTAYRLLAIEEGTARVDRDGETVATLSAGEVVGETGLLGRARRNAAVVATSPIRLIHFPGSSVRRLRNLIPDFDERIQVLAAERAAPPD